MKNSAGLNRFFQFKKGTLPNYNTLNPTFPPSNKKMVLVHLIYCLFGSDFFISFTDISWRVSSIITISFRITIFL